MGGVQVGHDSGTMVAYGTGPMPGATMVVNADASSSRTGTLGPSGTFVTAGGEAGVPGGSDYQAAVQAASQGAEGSVMHPQAFAYELSILGQIACTGYQLFAARWYSKIHTSLLHGAFW